jgi:glycosyltransferase involved in cell wall biosynthesis
MIPTCGQPRTIWLVTPEWRGQGGVGDYTHFLAGHLAALGCSVVVFGPPDRPDGSKRAVPYVRREVPGAWSLRALLHLVRLARAERPDVMHLQFVPHGFHPRGLPTALCLLPLLVRLASPARPVVTFHELFISWEGGLAQRALGLLQRLQALLLAAPSCAVVVTLEGRAAWLGRRLPHRRSAIFVVPVGSNVPVVPLSASERCALRRQLFGSDRVFVLGIFSPQHPAVDLEGVVAALSELPHEVRLLVIGRVPAERCRAVRQRAAALGVSRRICWTGSLSAEAVSQALQAVDVYVHAHPSGPSPRSTALAAALAHGLPVVAYAGTEDQSGRYQNGKNLVLVRAGQPCALAAAVERLWRDEALRQELVAGGRSLYRDSFTWEKIAAMTLYTYISACWEHRCQEMLQSM